MRLTAITGGIGSGKSVVSRMLGLMGYDVFDCDSEAKRIMDEDCGIKNRLREEIHKDAIGADGAIDRKLISSIVFADKRKLGRLNEIVHEAVKTKLAAWCEEPHNSNHLFVETAILYQSGLDKMVDDVLEVIADDETRILRVMKRNNCNEADVQARIESQRFTPEKPHSHVTVINNDGMTAVLPQLTEYLKNS